MVFQSINSSFCHGLQFQLRGRGGCIILGKVVEEHVVAY